MDFDLLYKPKMCTSTRCELLQQGQYIIISNVIPASDKFESFTRFMREHYKGVVPMSCDKLEACTERKANIGASI